METRAKKGNIIFAQAPILKRLLAFIIDIAILEFIVLLPFSRALDNSIPKAESFSQMFGMLSSNPSYYGLVTITTAIASFLAMLYFVILEKKIGQTAGKKLLNLHVISQEKDISYWQIIVRNLLFIPIFPFVLLWIVDPIVMLFTKENQRLSEILSRTKVVERYNIRDSLDKE